MLSKEDVILLTAYVYIRKALHLFGIANMQAMIFFVDL